jgi:hypothetical protein
LEKGEIIMKKSFSNSLLFWVLPGLIAGVMFLSIALVTGAMTTNFWAMPDAIARVIGIAAPTEYGFAPVPVLVGIAVHLAFSIGLGVIFTAVARWLRLHGWVLVVAGLLFIMLETPLALWVVLHSLLPTATFSYFLSAVPWWGSVFGRCTYGLVLGLLLNRFATWKPQEPTTRLAGESIE